MATQEPWDRLDDETPAPWAAFQAFLHMADRPRSLGKLAELRWEQAPAEGYAYHTLEHWSGDFEWFARAAEWDEHLERARRRGVTKVVEREGERWAKARLRVLDKMQTVVDAKLDSVINNGEVDVHQLNAHATIRLIREFLLGTRLEEGKATERTETGTDYSRYSDEQLAAIEQIMNNPDRKP